MEVRKDGQSCLVQNKNDRQNGQKKTRVKGKLSLAFAGLFLYNKNSQQKAPCMQKESGFI